MKYRILALLTILTVLFTTPSFAGYPVKHTATTENAQTISTLDSKTPATIKLYDKISNATDKVAHKLHIPVTPGKHRHSDTLGLLSFIFGILGLVFLLFTGVGGLLFSIAATVLGAMGLHRDEDFSLAGLIMGIIGVVLAIIVIVVVVALLTSLV